MIVEVRSDHLRAIVKYALQQAADSEVPVLDYDANEQALDVGEQIEYMECLLQQLEELTVHRNEILVIK